MKNLARRDVPKTLNEDLSRLLRTAITLCALSILFSSSLIVGLFLLLFLGWHTEQLILACLFSSVLSLIVSVVFFIGDVFLTLKALKLEAGKYLQDEP